VHPLAHPRETVPLDGVWQAVPGPTRTFEERFLPRIDRIRGMDPEELATEVDTEFPVDQAMLEDPPLDFGVDDGLPIRIPRSWAIRLPAYERYEGWMWHARRFDWDGDGNGDGDGVPDRGDRDRVRSPRDGYVEASAGPTVRV